MQEYGFSLTHILLYKDRIRLRVIFYAVVDKKRIKEWRKYKDKFL